MNIIITGAGGGVGLSIARYYANLIFSSKINLCLITRSSRIELDNFLSEYSEKFNNIIVNFEDVTNILNMNKVLSDFQEKFGAPDLVFANAGVAITNKDSVCDIECAARNIDTNYFGVLNTIGPVINEMLIAKGGQIVIISSIASYRATFNSGEYSASKAAINLWAESLRLNLKKYKIAVSVIKLGFVDTNMTKGNNFKMFGIISPDKCAELICKKIKSRKSIYLIPYKSALLWWLFNKLPNQVYDLLIAVAARKMLK